MEEHMNKKAITLTVALLSLSASLAFAAGSISLYVADCGAGTTTNTITNACTLNTGSYSLVASCVLPVSITDFVSAGAVVDVQTDAATIPDWWRGDGAGCRAGAITSAMDATVAPSCATIWDGQANIIPLFSAMITDPTRVGNDVPVNRVRLNSIGALSTSGIALTADGTTELGVAKFTITRTKSTGAGSCAGCASSACIVLNEINLIHEQPGVDPIRITDGSTTNRMVTYNASGMVIVCPDAVPVRNRTWGSVKALYR
jgi:hypothetical protein